MKMKEVLKTIGIAALVMLVGLPLLQMLLEFLLGIFGGIGTGAKPVIYLYPEQTTEVSVQLEFDGVLTSTYPAYQDGWTVTAQPDGTLTDASGREYYCLFWEGDTRADRFGFDQGWCIAGEDTAEFLEEKLREIGLTDKEANEFIIYWLPRMEGNAYNLISFQTDAYEEAAKLTVSPEPDSVLRVFMVWQGVPEKVEIEPQTFAEFERIGFTLVEWGGMEK